MPYTGIIAFLIFQVIPLFHNDIKTDLSQTFNIQIMVKKKMIIKDVRHFKLRGKSPVQKGFWEERLIRPIDIYERFKNEGPSSIGPEDVFEQTFLEN